MNHIVSEGMDVIDATGNKLGEITKVWEEKERIIEGSEEQPEGRGINPPTPASGPPTGDFIRAGMAPRESLIEPSLQPTTDFDEKLANEPLQTAGGNYMQVKSGGLLSKSLYIPMTAIKEVRDQQVLLRFTKDELENMGADNKPDWLT